MDLGEVMDEVGDRLDTLDGLRVHRYPADAVTPPAAVITYPDEYMYDDTYARGMDRMTLPVVVLVGKVSERVTRNRVADWLNRSGTRRHTVEKVAGQLTKHTMTVDGTHASAAVVEDGYLKVALTAGTVPGFSNLRDAYIRDGITGADFHARATFDPPFFGDAGGGLLILPQHGLVLRYQRDTKQRAVVVWQNIFFGVPTLNVGVWQANLDGTGFVNRNYPGWPPPVGLPFPYTVEARLRGNIVNARLWQVGDPVPNWDDPVRARTINLDTQAGDAVAVPTPVGVGGAGVVAAHLGTSTSPLSAARYPLADLYLEVDSASIKDTLEADQEAYKAFDSLRVTGAEFDVVQVAGVDYLAATLSIDIAGEGAA